MEELEGLYKGLKESNTLLLKECESHLQCEFMKGGMVVRTVLVYCPILASALRQECIHGILEGNRFTKFLHNFSRFSLHVKTRKLYQELSNQYNTSSTEASTMAIA